MQTKTGKLLVEDRDLAFLFLDSTGIIEANDATPITVEIADGVDDWESEDDTVWLSDDTGGKMRVVPRDTVWGYEDNQPLIDFEKDGFPVPTPVVIADKAAWDAYKADMGYDDASY